MEASSAEFDRVIHKGRMTTGDPRYRNALFHLLASQTSCYRYWGQGPWTEYGREICRRTEAILSHGQPRFLATALPIALLELL
jgi:hypothetical protein